jgi:preprotein translocase subunit Sss1
MRDPKQLQIELDAAQADLQSHLAQLKHLVEDKLERPKHVIEEVKHVVEVAQKPFAWLHEHALIVAVGALFAGAATGVVVGALKQRR